MPSCWPPAATTRGRWRTGRSRTRSPTTSPASTRPTRTTVNFIAIMKLYNLYRFDGAVQSVPSVQPQSAQASARDAGPGRVCGIDPLSADGRAAEQRAADSRAAAAAHGGRATIPGLGSPPRPAATSAGTGAGRRPRTCPPRRYRGWWRPPRAALARLPRLRLRRRLRRRRRLRPRRRPVRDGGSGRDGDSYRGPGTCDGDSSGPAATREKPPARLAARPRSRAGRSRLGQLPAPACRRRNDRRPVPAAVHHGGDYRVFRDREGAGQPRRAPLPRRGRADGHPLGAARRLRLDAVQGASAVLPRPRGEDRRAQLRRDQLRHQVGRARAVRTGPDRTGGSRVRNRPDRSAADVGARPGRRVRRVPLGGAAGAARRLGDGVPLLGGRAHRPAPENALARHRRPGRSRPAGRAVPRTVRRRPGRAQPRLPGNRLNGQKAQATPCSGSFPGSDAGPILAPRSLPPVSR